MRKIADLPEARRCRHPNHNPPGMFQPRESGVYEHVCPGCGAKQIRIFRSAECGGKGGSNYRLTHPLRRSSRFSSLRT